MFKWETIEPVTIIPGFHGPVLHSGRMSFGFWRTEAGAILPQHSHPRGRMVHQLEGELELIVEGVSTVSKPGTVVVAPPDAMHSGRGLTDCRRMDTFCPLRGEGRRQEGPRILRRAMGGRD